MSDLDWSRWPNFSEAEMRCKETGRCEMNPAFMDRLQRLRMLVGKPLKVTSGYRDPSHSAERAKPQPGTHAMGRASDIEANGQLQFFIVAQAVGLGFKGIGIAKTFIHLDDWDGAPRPNIWIY